MNIVCMFTHTMCKGNINMNYIAKFRANILTIKNMKSVCFTYKMVNLFMMYTSKKISTPKKQW